MKPKSLLKLAGVTVIFALALCIGACEKEEAVPIESEPESNRPVELQGKGIVFGHVVDAQTGEGIAGADVKLTIGNIFTLSTTTSDGTGAAPAPATPPVEEPPTGGTTERIPGPAFHIQSAKTMAAAGSGEGSERQQQLTERIEASVGETALAKGAFQIELVPSGEHKLTISKQGYAIIEKMIQVFTTEGAAFFSANDSDSDTIKMERGFDAKVVLTLDGAPVAGAAVFLNRSFLARILEKTGVTDAEGVVVFAGIPQMGYYDVTVPARDTNGDGLYDYATFSNFGQAQIRNQYVYLGPNTVWTVNLIPFRPGTELAVVGSTCSKYIQLVVGQGCSIQKDDVPVRFVLNQPVEISLSDKVFLTKLPAWGQPAKEIEVDAVMKAANTVLELSPKEALEENNFYVWGKADGTAGLISNISFSYMAGGILLETNMKTLLVAFEGLYIIPAAPITVESVEIRHNGAAGQVAEVRLVFPKPVTAKAMLISTDPAQRVPPPPPVMMPLFCETGPDVAANKIVHACALVDSENRGVRLQDGNKVTLRFMATDHQGNTINTAQPVTLVVK